MQSIQTRLIIISGLAVFIFFGYLAFQESNSPQSGDQVTLVSQSGTSVVVNTGKTLSGSTATISGTWIDSPFGSGKPLTGEEKPVFRMPNTEWKTRTLNINGKWLTYEYGKGNPNEVALDDNGIQDLAKQCADFSQIDHLYKIGSCIGNPSGTARPLNMYKEVETYLLAGLSDPNWMHLAVECQPAFRETEKFASLPPRYYDAIFASGYLDIESFISINTVTGRKSLDLYRIRQLINDLDRATTSGGQYNTAGGPDNLYGACVDQYSPRIIENLRQSVNWYLIPE
jgi:hypothetical protein